MTLEGKLYIEYWGGPHAAIEQLHRRVSELEERTCDGSSATTPAASGTGTRAVASDTATTGTANGASATSDRPAWITDEMLPLPVGTERVRKLRSNGRIGAFPGCHIWYAELGEREWLEKWSASDETRWADESEVWHVPQVKAVTDHATKGSAWERWQDWRDAQRPAGWKEVDSFNAFVAAEVARAGKGRRPAREVAQRCVLELKIHGVAMMTTERERDIAVQVVAAAIERDREEGAR